MAGGIRSLRKALRLIGQEDDPTIFFTSWVFNRKSGYWRIHPSCAQAVLGGGENLLGAIGASSSFHGANKPDLNPRRTITWPGGLLTTPTGRPHVPRVPHNPRGSYLNDCPHVSSLAHTAPHFQKSLNFSPLFL